MKVHYKKELKKLYDPLKIKIANKQDSLIGKLVKDATKSKTKVDYESVSCTISNPKIASELESLGYIIRHNIKYHEYSITGLGIWEYEKSREKIDEKTLMSILHNEYLLPESKPIKDDERIILASLLLCRIFNEQTQIDLNRDQSNRQHNKTWHKITVDVMNILYKVKFIKKVNFKFVSHPDITYLMVRANYLRSKTHGIYSRSNTGTHFLDISDTKGKIDLIKLNEIYNFIFGNKISDLSYFRVIKEQLKSFARQNRYKLNKNRLFLDQNTTTILLDSFERKYLEIELL